MKMITDHSHGLKSEKRGSQGTWQIGGIVIVYLLIWACTNDRSGTKSQSEELVYTESSASWFEEGNVSGGMSPDGRWLILADWQFRKVVDVENGHEATWEEVVPNHGLTQLFGLRGAGGGRTGLYGFRDGEAGWFVHDSTGTFFTGLTPLAAPAWSPDGKSRAYFMSGTDTLFITGPTGEVGHIRIGARPASLPVWTPDGGAVILLALGDDGAGSLFRVTAADHAVEVLRDRLYISEVANHIAISPDNRKVFLALAGSEAPAPEDRHLPEPQRTLDIYAFDFATGTLTPVVQSPHPDFAPVVSGKWLFWTRNVYQDAVVLIPAWGGEARTLVENAFLPTWSHDGRKVAFTHGNFGGVDGAISMDAAAIDVDEEGRRAGSSVPIVTGFHEDFTPTWSPDGTWIAYHSHRSSSPVAYYSGEGTTDDIYLRRPGAPMSEEIRLTDFGWEVGLVDWAPDGRRLAFCSWERGGRPSVAKPWIVSIAPANGRVISIERLMLPEYVDNATMPVWSPDGREIAVDVRRNREQHELWVIGADGSGSERLVDFRSVTYGGVHWTPDGKFLVYAALTDGRKQIFRISRLGGQPEQLTQDSGNLLHPRISPDGRWIAATRLVRRKEIWKMELR